MSQQPNTPALLDTLRPLPASERVRQRLLLAGQRFHANDNIADYLHDGELAAIEDEVAGRAQALLRALVIDTDNDHNTRDTGRRLAKMFVRELFAGRYQPAPAVTEFPNAERLNELMIVGPLRVRSACSHHLCPIIGHVWIGVLPDAGSNLIGLSKYARLIEWIMSRPQIQEDAGSNLIGLSKYARLIEWIMSRPQIQEEAVSQIAHLLEQRLKPDGLAVVMEADHYCMHWRGVKDDGSKMTNSVMRGRFLDDPALRREFLSLRHRG
jgi:GTP cyclohydrolase I